MVTLPIPEGLIMEVGGLATLPDGTYSVNGNEYYLKVDGSTKPTLRTVNNRQELLMPLTGASNVKYSIIW